LLNRVVIIGAGLIGGSFALGIKRAGIVQHVAGIERDPAAVQRAIELSIIDSSMDPRALREEDVDLVMIAAPVAQTKAILKSILPYLPASTIVTDAGSTKADVVAAAREVMGDRIGQFVPGHPIAGREKNGPDAAVDDLFVGKKVVLTPLAENRPEDVERVAAAWRACGAVVHKLSPEEHDKVFASVSHLPHLLAYALVDDIAQKPHAGLLFQYAASGFRDFTRIAGSSPEMWRDISLANREALLGELDAYLVQLKRLRDHLAAGEGGAIESVYSNAQQARQRWIDTIESAEPPQPQDSAE
jgi:prephenate dehydrogenase